MHCLLLLLTSNNWRLKESFSWQISAHGTSECLKRFKILWGSSTGTANSASSGKVEHDGLGSWWRTGRTVLKYTGTHILENCSGPQNPFQPQTFPTLCLNSMQLRCWAFQCDFQRRKPDLSSPRLRLHVYFLLLNNAHFIIINHRIPRNGENLQKWRKSYSALIFCL